MRPLIPQFILQQLAADRMSGSFPAAGMFIDISGFSRITDALMQHGQHGAEVLAGLMKTAFAPLVESVYAQGGFVATLSGDALQAIFVEDAGAPAVARALAAASAARARLAANPEQITPYGTFTLPIKAGIASGNVEWCIVSALDEQRAGYYFRGEAVDGCAEAEALATAGEIVLTQTAYEQVRSLVAVDPTEGHFRVRAVTGSLPADRPIVTLPADPALAARFFPQMLLDHPHEGEFRQVVSVFVGLPTLRTQAQMIVFMRELFSLQDRYGGLFSRLEFGDKGAHLLLFWGAPVAYENDVERALNLVLALQERSAIPINVGVTTTIAYAGFSGSSLRQEYTAFGRGVNLAARFMTAAPRGEIWIDENIAARAEALFEVAYERDQQFKGFSTQQKVFSLFDRKEIEFAVQSHEMFGREGEIERLTAFVRPIFEGRYAGVMLVSGDAGIGKSRLVQRLQAPGVMANPDVFWALCQTDEILRESLNPFTYWLKRYFGQAGKQSQAGNKRSFNRRVDALIASTDDRRLAAELDRTRSFLGALVGLTWSDSLYEQLDAQGRYENTMQGLLTLIQAESRRQALVLLVEDGQWLDEDSRLFLARLARTLTFEEQQPFPIAILVTARPGPDPVFADGVVHEEIRLGELPSAGLFELAREQLGGPPSPALLDLLLSQAQGNPFFAVQVLLYLQEQGLLTESKAGWAYSESQEVPLPPDVRALLVARLDALSWQVKEAVQTASVLGQEFELPVLERMLVADEPLVLGSDLSRMLVSLVSSAEQAAIWNALTQIRYIFRHALLRDVAYSMQLRSRLQALHALAVTTLETVYEGEEHAPFAELGYHAERAGMADRAHRYLKLAGDRATEAFQNSQAVQYYGRALAFVPAGEDTSRFELLMARAKVLQLSGRREAQRQDLTALMEIAARLGEAHVAEVLLEQARLEGATGNYEGAVAAAREAVERAHAANAASVLAGGYLLWGWFLYRQSDFTGARERYEAARSYAQSAAMPAEEANSLNGLGVLATEEGDFAGSRDYYEQARALYRLAGRLAGEGNILNNLAVLVSRQGRHVEAKRYYEEALALRRQIGDRKGEGNTANNLGEAWRAMGWFAEAEQHYSLSLDIRREIGDLRGEALATLSLAILSMDIGDYARARRLNDRALAIVRDIEDRMLEGAVLMYQGSAIVRLRDVDAGLALCEQAVLVLRQVDNRVYLGYALRRWGEALIEKGRLPEALAAYREAAGIGEELDPYLLAQANAGMVDVFLAEGRRDEALTHAEAALGYLKGMPLAEVEDPFPVVLSCYRALAPQGDPRAEELLRSAYGVLQERAGRLADPGRETYLNAVPTHRALIAACKEQD